MYRSARRVGLLSLFNGRRASGETQSRWSPVRILSNADLDDRLARVRELIGDRFPEVALA